MDLNNLKKKIDKTIKQLTQIKTIIKKNKTQKKQKKNKNEKDNSKIDAPVETTSTMIDATSNNIAANEIPVIDVSSNSIATETTAKTTTLPLDAPSTAISTGGKRKTNKSKL